MRRTLRILKIAGLVLSGTLTLLLFFPFLDRDERDRRIVRWAGQLVRIVGGRVKVLGRAPMVRGGGALIVANHVSWLDIHALHSVLPARFITKADVRHWPLIGWMAEATGTLFLERSRKSDAAFFDPCRQAMPQEEILQLEKAFDELPDDSRQVLTMYRIVGIGLPDLARELGRTEAATKMVLSRAMAKLTTALARKASKLPPRPPGKR